jgi:hypothetical protein
MTRRSTIYKSIKAIAGRPPSTYAGGKSGDSELSNELRGLLETALWDALTGEQLDHISRILSGAAAYLRERGMAKRYRRKEDWPRRGSPTNDHLSHWIDHASTLTEKETGKKTLLSEPYQLLSNDIKALASLIEQGWDVSVDARISSWFPGSTVGVALRKSPPASPPK